MENALHLYLHVIASGELHIPEMGMLSQTLSAKADSGAATAPPPAPVSPAPVSPAPPHAPTPGPFTIPTAPPAPAPTTLQTPAPAVPPAPAPTVPPIQAGPTEAPTYSMDEISRAGAELAQQGPDKLAALNGLLQQFGLQAVTQLRPEQMGAFVTAMRGLGAKI